jgi:signal peptidase II
MHLFWLITALSFAISYLSKLLGDAFLENRLSMWGDFIGLQLAHNDGVAFSMNLGGMLQLPLILLALGFVVYLAFHSDRSRLHQIGFGLIVGGALGNVLDRLPDGLVTDFVRIGSFPVFNVADSCITVGVVLLLLEMLLRKRSYKRS